MINTCGDEYCHCSIKHSILDCNEEDCECNEDYYCLGTIMDYQNMPPMTNVIYLASHIIQNNCKRITNLPYYVSCIEMRDMCMIYLDSTKCASQKYKIVINDNIEHTPHTSMWNIFNHFSYKSIDYGEEVDCQLVCAAIYFT
jgi:hypothetical protein